MSRGTKRRLAAIVSADIVGYSRLMGEDEANTLASLRQWRSEVFGPTVSGHQGDIVKSMGDGWLVAFDSAVDAVTCAIQVQESLTGHDILKLRIGLHIGDITYADDDIFGDGVNIAARLQEIAEPGAIVISDTAQRSIDGKHAADFANLGHQALKNIANPVAAYGWGMSEVSRTSIAPALPEKPSIAVLPFDNMSGDSEQEYFSDGISEDIITDLSKISALFVIARNSSFSYKGQAVNIQHIARVLGVHYVVEGSVRKAGNRVRITAQLINAKTGGHVWADRFDRELVDIFAVQDEITSQIVDALQLVLLPKEATLVARAPTYDIQAYDFYLKARQCFNLNTKAKLIEARQWFERAITSDPKFARAYCGLADCGSKLYSEYDTNKAHMDGVMEAVTKALDIEPDLAEAHASKGLALSGSLGMALSKAGDVSKAEDEFAIAIELDPDLYEAHYYWARHCFEQGNLAAAAAHFEEAWRVSPRDPKTPSLLNGIYRDLNRVEDMKATAQKSLDAGLQQLELAPNDSQTLLICASALAHLDRDIEAKAMMDRASKIDPTDRIVIYNIACAYATMGETEIALDYLDKMTGTGKGNLDWIKNDGDLDSLRDHPRFHAFLARLGSSSASPEI